jgi:Domain of unknown function (DUF4406)
MLVIYVAGPVRHSSHFSRHLNIVRGEIIAAKLWQLGFAVICPHKNCEFLDGAIGDEQILNGDLAIIAKCDGVVFMYDWNTSVGASAEFDYCLLNDIPIFVLGDIFTHHTLHNIAHLPMAVPTELIKYRDNITARHNLITVQKATYAKRLVELQKKANE